MESLPTVSENLSSLDVQTSPPMIPQLVMNNRRTKVVRESKPVKNRYEYLSLDTMRVMIPIGREFKVAKTALSEDKFVDNFLQGRHTEDFWIKKRNGYISRAYAIYQRKPTWRRYLSLIMWGFNPIPDQLFFTEDEFNQYYVKEECDVPPPPPLPPVEVVQLS